MSLSLIAFLSAAVPPTAVYLVWPAVERLVGGALDMFGSVEVGLAGGQRDDVDTGELHFSGARVGRERRGRFDGGDSAIELQHFLNPDFRMVRATISRREPCKLYLPFRFERTAQPTLSFCRSRSITSSGTSSGSRLPYPATSLIRCDELKNRRGFENMKTVSTFGLIVLFICAICSS